MAPSSRGLGHSTFTAATRVRISSGSISKVLGKAKPWRDARALFVFTPTSFSPQRRVHANAMFAPTPWPFGHGLCYFSPQASPWPKGHGVSPTSPPWHRMVPFLNSPALQITRQLFRAHLRTSSASRARCSRPNDPSATRNAAFDRARACSTRHRVPMFDAMHAHLNAKCSTVPRLMKHPSSARIFALALVVEANRTRRCENPGNYQAK